MPNPPHTTIESKMVGRKAAAASLTTPSDSKPLEDSNDVINPIPNNDDRDDPDDLNSDDLNEIDYGDDDDLDEDDEALNQDDDDEEEDDDDDGESSSDHNIALSDHVGDIVDDDEHIEGSRQSQGDEDNMEDSDQGKNDGDKSATERCKYWPACNAGESCNFYHPTKPCRNFPKCAFGDKCLYIHPACKFNQNCARSDCPFAHPAVLTAPVAKRRPPANHQFGAIKHHTAPVAGTPKCKYGFKCNNLMCKFSHQAVEPCRYGANCLLETCPFSHPTDLPRKKPTSVFKWNAQS